MKEHEEERTGPDVVGKMAAEVDKPAKKGKKEPAQIVEPSASELTNRKRLGKVRRNLCGKGTRCRECGLRVRSVHHCEGDYHKQRKQLVNT